MRNLRKITAFAIAATALATMATTAEARRPNAAQQQAAAFVAAVTHYCMANVEGGVELPQVAVLEGHEVVALTAEQASAARMAATSTGYRLNHARGHILIESATGKACQAKAEGPPAQASFDGVVTFITDPARGFNRSLDMSNPPMTFMRMFTKPVGEENLVVMLNGIQPRGAASMLNATVSRIKREAPAT
ncbi:MAG: hypothetical protein IV086_01355 [Hyphomonadaceae bacterium]|nr:MAG: hypothetical protein FD160_3046 [Caulobacteraceae bacterium]MBT9444324.1 hypothetical protein [Hyphomonadaceae bacterium]TPW02497.1 MAG: hypothetical protein FD124_3382 [Alphaproteobacteria bacterium]